MSVAMAYLRRDYLIWSSYRLAALWQVLSIIAIGGLIYFAGNAIGDRSDLVKEEDGSYVAYVLVGLAFMDVLLQGVGTLPRAISEHQRSGTLEPMLLAPITDLTLLLSFWMFRFLLALARMLSLLAFGFIVLGFWRSANPAAVVAVLIPAEVTLLAVGALSAAFVVLVKQGDPVRMGYTGITTLLSGAFFPIAVLPPVLRGIALGLPVTHAMTGVREALDGGSVAEVVPQVATLWVMALVLLPIGLYAFHWSLQRARQEGSLGEY